jgi:hypothetical protein
MAINYYIEKTGDNVSVSAAINDLKNNIPIKVEPIIFEKRMYDLDLDLDEVFHSIYLLGSQSERKLYAIIELFNAVSFIVKLSENYNLPDIEELYVLMCYYVKRRKKG